MLIVRGLQIWKKDTINEDNCGIISNVINEWARTYKKKAQLRSKEIALEASSKTFSLSKSLARCNSYQLQSFYYEL